MLVPVVEAEGVWTGKMLQAATPAGRSGFRCSTLVVGAPAEREEPTACECAGIAATAQVETEAAVTDVNSRN